jgi:hypothetical protein
MVMVHHKPSPTRSNAMTSFLQRFGAEILGVLSGFDRIRFRGSLPRLANTRVFSLWLAALGIPLKDFSREAAARTQQLRAALETKAAEAGRPVEYLQGFANKEVLVQRRRQRDGTSPGGLVCAFSTLENCTSYDIYRNAKTHQVELRRRPRKGLHYYFYFEDSRFGLSQVRLQTWFPFQANVVLNGREWLAGQLDAKGIGYQRRDNCFTWIEDFARVQKLASKQPQIPWPTELDRLLWRVLPSRRLWLPDESYYWTVAQSEWATDLAFRSTDALAELYPQLIRRGIETFRSEDVLRFLGQRVTAQGHVPANRKDEITSDLKHRPEGVRIKHRAGRNAVKLYDKQGSVLRVETTINEVKGFKSYRTKADDPEGPLAWRPMRKGVAEMARRADLSQASNDRYLEALGGLPADTPLCRASAKLCRTAIVDGRRYRGLNPLAADDARLLEAISRGEWLVAGFRNRDIRQALHGNEVDESKRRRQSAAVTRLLGILRAHGLIKKIPRTHRYLMTVEGTSVIPALLAANNATLQQLTSAA